MCLKLIIAVFSFIYETPCSIEFPARQTAEDKWMKEEASIECKNTQTHAHTS